MYLLITNVLWITIHARLMTYDTLAWSGLQIRQQNVRKVKPFCSYSFCNWSSTPAIKRKAFLFLFLQYISQQWFINNGTMHFISATRTWKVDTSQFLWVFCLRQSAIRVFRGRPHHVALHCQTHFVSIVFKTLCSFVWVGFGFIAPEHMKGLLRFSFSFPSSSSNTLEASLKSFSVATFTGNTPSLKKCQKWDFLLMRRTRFCTRKVRQYAALA